LKDKNGKQKYPGSPQVLIYVVGHEHQRKIRSLRCFFMHKKLPLYCLLQKKQHQMLKPN